MAVTLKADTEDFPSILSLFGLGGMPREAADTGPTPLLPPEGQSGSQSRAQDTQPSSPAGPTKLSFLQNVLNGVQPSVDVSQPDYSKIGTPSGPPADIATGAAQEAQPLTPSTFQQKHPTLSKILGVGLSLARGAAAGAGSNTFGEGYGKAQELPLQVQGMQLENQTRGIQNEQARQSLPFLRANQVAGLQKSIADAARAGAEADKAQAEVRGMPVKQALEQAQTEAAYYKDDPNQGLVDIRTGKPVAGNANLVPLNADEAAILGKQDGDRVPLKLKNTANEIVNRGVHMAQANGRSLIVNSKGQTVKDLGVSTPLAVINAQMSGPGVTASGALVDPNMETVAQSVAAGKQDLATALRPYMRYPGKANAMEARVLQINPDYYQGDYANRLKVLEKATQGSWADQKIAFNTMLQHADLLDQAAKALNNKDNKTYNAIKNKLASEFGDSDLTNFQAIANAYNHEVTSVISKGHITDSEVKQGDATMPSNANYDTIHKVLSSYRALAQSKMNQVNKQIKAGMAGTAGLTNSAKTGTHPAEKQYPGFVVDQ